MKVLILGGSSDIGLEVTKQLLDLKWKVTSHYNSNKSFVKNIENKNLDKIFLDFSKINYKNINKVINKKIKSNYDAVINLVGFIDNKSFNNMNLKSITRSITINALLPIMIEKRIIKNMLKKKWGRILNCSSIGVKFGGGKNSYNYSFSKHCLEFIPNEHKQWTKNDVLINNIRIGVTDTKIHRKMKTKGKLKERINLIPMKRMATPKEIAKYISNLISDNSYMTGQTITISGGE